MAASAAKIVELQTRIAELQKERDELADDVERLCLQTCSSKFDPTSLLTERLRGAESDVKQLRQQLSILKGERDTIYEELRQACCEKTAIEQLSERCASLQRDVNFYKDKAIKAMADRDQEVENMRSEAVESELRLREVTNTLQLAQTANKDLQAQMNGLQSELHTMRQRHLQEQAASTVVDAELRQLRDNVALLEDGAQKLKAQLSEVQAEASHTHKLLKQAHKIEDQLTAQVRELQAELAKVRHPQSSEGQSPSSPPMPRSRPGSAGGASVDEPCSSPAAPRAPSLAAPPQSLLPASSSPPATSSSSSSPAAAGAGEGASAGAAAPPPPRSPALSPRGSARALSAANAAAVTVTAAEAVAPGQPPPDLATAARPPSSTDEAPPGVPAAEAAPWGAAAEGVDPAVEAAIASHGALLERIRELQAALAQAQDELSKERAVHEDEREQLQVLRTMAHDFKIKLAQATQEKVQALMRTAQLTQSAADAKHQQQEVAASAGGGGQALPAPPQRQASMSSERSSRDISRSLSSSFGLYPAPSAPGPGAGGGGQPPSRSLWAALLGGTGGSWYGTPAATAAATTTAATTMAGAAPAAPVAAPAAGAQQYAASVASEEGSEAEGGVAASAAAAAAAHAATVEAAEGRSRRLATQLERVRSQLAAVDRLAGQVGRCEVRLRSCAALLWSSREEDAPRRWAALGDLTRLAEECAALRAEAGLPPSAAGAAPQPAGPTAASADLPPVIPLALADADFALRSNQHWHPHQRQGQEQQRGEGSYAHGTGAADGGGGSGGEYDSSLVCTREAGGVQRRVAEVLLGSVEFGVRSLEQYNHHSALSSVLYS